TAPPSPGNALATWVVVLGAAARAAGFSEPAPGSRSRGTHALATTSSDNHGESLLTEAPPNPRGIAEAPVQVWRRGKEDRLIMVAKRRSPAGTRVESP